MDDIRWFAPNRYCALPVPRLREGGLSIAVEGNAPARLAFAADAQCAVAGYEFARRHRVPLVLYLADLPPWRLGGGRPDPVFFFGGRVRRLPRVTGRYAERPGYYSRIRFVALGAREVWAYSRPTAEDIRGRFGVGADVVHCCFDSDRFRETAPPVSGRPPMTLLAISRLVPHKDHGLVVETAARLGPEWRVRIVGQGPEAPRLRTLARERGVALDVNDAWASDAEIVAAYRSADAVISASRFEGLGLSPVEGLAMRRPVAASDIPAHREFLGDRVAWFPPGDAAAAARAVLAARAAAPGAGPIPELTIEACAARMLPRFRRLLEEPA